MPGGSAKSGMEKPNIRYITIIVVAAVQLPRGGLWYSPAYFGGPWTSRTGITPSITAAMSPWKTYGLTFLAYLALCLVLVHALSFAKARTQFEGAVVGFWNWFGFVATILAVTNRFQHQPWSVWAIDAGYQCVNFVLAGIVLTMWPKKTWGQPGKWIDWPRSCRSVSRTDRD